MAQTGLKPYKARDLTLWTTLYQLSRNGVGFDCFDDSVELVCAPALADLEDLAQLVLNRNGLGPFSELLDRAIEQRLHDEDPAWQELSPLLRRWQKRVERTEVLLQGLEFRTH